MLGNSADAGPNEARIFKQVANLARVNAEAAGAPAPVKTRSKAYQSIPSQSLAKSPMGARVEPIRVTTGRQKEQSPSITRLEGTAHSMKPSPMLGDGGSVDSPPVADLDCWQRPSRSQGAYARRMKLQLFGCFRNR
jgi:hypothetical protein